MDRYVQRFLNRVALALTVIATLSLLHLFYHSSLNCSAVPPPHRRHHSSSSASHHYQPQFPRSSCDAAARDLLTPEKRFLKLRSTNAWRRRVADLSALFALLRSLSLLRNASHVLCVSAGAGHAVAALQDSGVADVTGVDLVDFPPLVSRADPHNLPFFDGVFDLGFSDGLDGALFPARFVTEIERTVRRGGASVLAVEGAVSQEEAEGIEKMFRRSSSIGVSNATIAGAKVTLIMMRHNGNPSS